jgi:hypothetical protein
LREGDPNTLIRMQVFSRWRAAFGCGTMTAREVIDIAAYRKKTEPGSSDWVDANPALRATLAAVAKVYRRVSLCGHQKCSPDRRTSMA